VGNCSVAEASTTSARQELPTVVGITSPTFALFTPTISLLPLLLLLFLGLNVASWPPLFRLCLVSKDSHFPSPPHTHTTH
jgi:hypothetical protein